MIKKILTLGFLTIVLGMFPAVSIVHAKGSETVEHISMAKSSPVVGRRFGPYATLRRANEVANYARSYGYSAKIIYAGSYIYGTREYYVDVW